MGFSFKDFRDNYIFVLDSQFWTILAHSSNSQSVPREWDEKVSVIYWILKSSIWFQTKLYSTRFKFYCKFHDVPQQKVNLFIYISCISIYREKSHEYDFLSSIEVIIADQTDVFLMQNWEHVQVCILLYQPL